MRDSYTRQSYHYLTLGLCENEIIRRVDPLERSFGRFLSEEIMAPLGEEFYVGLPPGSVLGYMNPRSLTARTLGNPKPRSPSDLDRPEYRRVELAAAGGIGTARAVAKAYGGFAAG